MLAARSSVAFGTGLLEGVLPTSLLRRWHCTAPSCPPTTAPGLQAYIAAYEFEGVDARLHRAAVLHTDHIRVLSISLSLCDAPGGILIFGVGFCGRSSAVLSVSYPKGARRAPPPELSHQNKLVLQCGLPRWPTLPGNFCHLGVLDRCMCVYAVCIVCCCILSLASSILAPPFGGTETTFSAMVE